MLLNKYQRQQRLRPEEQIDPMMRSMMDAVRQVYETKEESVEVPEEIKTELHEELLTEGVPSKIMDTYVQWLGPDYAPGAPYAIQSLHMQLMTVWFCLDFHWDKDRPWAATDKGMQIMEKVNKDLKTKSSMPGGLRKGLINESRVNCVKVWDSLFENKDNKKRWGVDSNNLSWKVNQKLFGLDKKSNPYGDIGGNTQRGEGFYLKMLMQKKMIVKVKPGMMNTDQNQTTGKFAV